MNTMQGIVHYIGETKEYGTRGFAKRALVLVEDPSSKYPNYAVFEATRSKKVDMTQKLSELEVGDFVEVVFGLSAHQWNNPKTGEIQWFGSATLTDVEMLTPNSKARSNDKPNAAKAEQVKVKDEPDVSFDDMPF